MVDVASTDAFNALTVKVASLASRVSALEAGGQPPAGTIPPVQAKAIHALIESLGVNTFSTMDANSNIWGTWPSIYTPAQVIAALNWLTAGSGFALRIREYHYAGRESFQVPWLKAIKAAIPRTKTTLAIGANGSVADVPSMLTMAADPTLGIAWLEGINEPNTDFGSGKIPPASTLTMQQAVAKAAGPAVMGPSIVAGTPHPEGWITEYAGATLPVLNTAMDMGNGHYYPPHCPDIVGDGTSLSEYVGGLWTAYAQHVIALPEFNPTLYSTVGNNPSGQRSPYYTLLALFRSVKIGVQGLWWFALFDWQAPTDKDYMACGLFPKDATNPRPAATALRNLCIICADHGTPVASPASFPVAIDGLDASCAWDLYQTSDGRRIVPLWRSADLPYSAPALATTLRLNAPASRIAVYDPMKSSAAQASVSNAASLAISLQPSACVVVIAP